MATIKDVSEYAGVSQATVSRVVNGSCRVSHDKKLRVEKAIQVLGYRPNAIAQALASSRTGSIGIIVPELGGPFYSGILHCIEEQFRRFGYHVIVTAGNNSEESQRESVEFLLGRRVDAMILHTQNLS
ncbi:TPA: LacI family transcriptional regulator, partial [Vibrio vulnificus]|nr:LacI family transcriptional regulator [Vibrio vulnificus]